MFIDPVRLAEDALGELPRPSAILLTATWHQRAAWRYRRQFGAEVWLPEDAPPGGEEPDRYYADGAALPGALVAIRSSSPDWPQYSLLRAAEPAVLFCPDLVWNHGGELHFVTAPGQEVSAATLRCGACLRARRSGQPCSRVGSRGLALMERSASRRP